jgi:hypothetical protein
MSTQEKITHAVTPLEEWGAVEEDEEGGFVTQLPESKHYVRVRRTLDMTVMLRTGHIPNPLARIIREMLTSGKDDFDMEKVDEKVLDQMLDLTDRIVVSSMLDPKVSAPERRSPSETDEQYAQRLQNFRPDPGTLSVFRIPLADRQFIAAVAQGRATELESFLSQQAALVADLQAGSGVVEPPVQPPRAVRRSAAKKKSA